MKVLCIHSGSGPFYVRDGWRKVFEFLGHKFTWWEVGKTPAFDAFGGVEPDIFLGTTYELNRETIKCIANRPNLKVGLFCSAWGNFFGLAGKIQEIRKTYPIDWITDEEYSKVATLKEQTGKPDFVFLHCLPSKAEEVIGNWHIQLGIPAKSVMNAADLFTYSRGEQRKLYQCDVAYVGGYWGYKGKNIDKYLIPLCYEDRYNVKIFSRTGWSVYQHVGDVPDEEVRHVFASTKVCPNISEPHSTTTLFPAYDCVERPFKVFSSGGCCVSDCKGFKEVLPHMELYATPEEFRALIEKYINISLEDREAYIEINRQDVLRSNTYFHRVANIFTHLGLPEEAERCLDVYKGAVWN